MTDVSEAEKALDNASLVAQLEDLYAERQRLHQSLGTANSAEIIAMIRSLEAQLVSLYGDRAARPERAELEERGH